MKSIVPHCLVAAAVLSAALLLPAGFPTAACAAPPATPTKEPPKSWVDPDTGHRIIRLTNEPGTDSFYFNVNAYTPDGNEMAYLTPKGISVVNLKTFKTRPVVTGRVRAIEVGHKTPTVYYEKATGKPFYSTLWCTNIDTGQTRKLADLPRRARIFTINSDETLAAGAYIEGNANDGGAYDGTVPHGRMSKTNLGVPLNKGQMMMRRLNAKLPMTMFTLNLKTGKITDLIQHSTHWLNHLQFSPTDPTLLMYCHEGMWWLVNRIWVMHTDGTDNQLVHQRTMEMEIAGHEWWGADGKTVYYQIHDRGMNISYIASYNLMTGQRVWYYYAPDMSSIHDNSSPDGKMFCGDGDRRSPWIFLFRPVPTRDRGTLGTNLIKTGYLKAERLVNMSKQNYRLEPNPSFTPDEKYIVFRSNMFGPDYAFAVEIAKAK